MKKGFTLTELLAVIAIIAVLSIVTVPIVVSYTEHAKYSAFENGVKSVYDTAKIYITAYEENGDLPIGGIKVEDLQSELKNFDYISGSIYRNSEGSIYIENISNGTYCASGTKSDLKIVKGTCNDLDSTPPALKIAVNNITSSGAIVVANAVDNQSGILGYSYSIDGINYSEISTKTVYEIKNLNSNQTLTVYIKAYNNKYDSTMSKENPNYEDMISSTVTEKSIRFTTLEVDPPMFKISTTESSSSTVKILEIIYPKNIGNYRYTYSIDNGEEITVDGENTRLTIDKNCYIVAKVYYDNKLVMNDIRISGIDNEGPKATIRYNTNWELSKKIKVEIIAETSGLPERPYSFDGGKTWQADNYKIFVQNETLKSKLMVRDRLGNITSKFTINGQGEETDEITFDYVDKIKPNCEIKVTGENNGSEWYSSDVTLELVNVVDYAKYCVNGTNCKNKTPGSGVKSQTISISKITTDTTGTKVTGKVIDNVGNTSTCEVTIKRDSFTPKINNNKSTITFKPAQNEDKIENYFDIEVGISGIKGVTCKVGNTVVSTLGDLYKINPSGVNTTCTFTTNSNKVVSGTINFKSGYSAVWSGCAYTVQVCGTHCSNCHSGHCGPCHGCCETACGWVDTNNEWCSDCCCDCSYGCSNECRSGYTCPNGGSLSGTMCYY